MAKMIEVKIRKPQCGGRECYLRCEGSIPQKVKGRTLLPGKRYCAGGKGIKAFRSSDPKVSVPSWCPLRKRPIVLRIYCFKNALCEMVQLMLQRDGAFYSPNDFDYALRYEGTTELTAAQFQEELQGKDVSDLLKVPAHENEVVEIDDGLTPYYFFFSPNQWRPYVVRFNGERARQNKLESPEEEDL